MAQFLIPVGFFIIAVGGMALALHFSQYKKRKSGCCGAGNCDSGEGGHHHSGGHGCYNEKSDFVDEYGQKKIKTELLNR